MKQTQAFLNDLETIVNIDSSSDNPAGILRVAQFFENRFKKLGLSCEILHLGGKKTPCLQAVTQKQSQRFDIMLLGHMDTVFPKGEALKRPFSRDDEKAYGPGVCDMKGGLLVALYALERLNEKMDLKSLSLCVAFNGDEETGSEDSKAWIMENAAKSKAVLVFEPCRPGYRVVTRRKGSGWFTVRTKGQSAHAGADPEKGANAVVEMAHQILAVNEMNDFEKGTSVQVTVVNGGDKVNIIPAEAKALVDVRISNKEEKDRVERFFENLPDRSKNKQVEISVEGHIDRPPMEFTPASQALYKHIESHARKMGLELQHLATGGCSDGNFASAMGIATIDGLGIVGSNSHRQDEYVEIESIDAMVGLVADVCAGFAPDI